MAGIAVISLKTRILFDFVLPTCAQTLPNVAKMCQTCAKVVPKCANMRPNGAIIAAEITEIKIVQGLGSRAAGCRTLLNCQLLFFSSTPTQRVRPSVRCRLRRDWYILYHMFCKCKTNNIFYFPRNPNVFGLQSLDISICCSIRGKWM